MLPSAHISTAAGTSVALHQQKLSEKQPGFGTISASLLRSLSSGLYARDGYAIIL